MEFWCWYLLLVVAAEVTPEMMEEKHTLVFMVAFSKSSVTVTELI